MEKLTSRYLLNKRWTTPEAIAHPAFAYARSRKLFGQWVTNIYLRCGDSPSGVVMASTIDNCWRDEEVTAWLYAFGKTSPLSPTEMR